MTVLVADDEPAVRRLIQRVLEKADFEVIAVADAEAARGLLRDPGASFAVALLDALLPPRGVGPLLDEIQQRTAAIGVVVTSGAALAPELDARLEALGGEFLHKPFGANALVASVRRCARAG